MKSHLQIRFLRSVCKFILIAAVLLLCAICSLWKIKYAHPSSNPPNILVLLVDDWGWGDLHINIDDKGGHGSKTPYMDTLARSGIRFTDFHTASSVCTPSRSALLTGRMGLRTDMNILMSPYSKGGLPLTETTLANLVKSKGYSTFAIGKWHLGHYGPYHPIKRGFDHYLGVPYSVDQGCLDYAGYINPPRATCENEKSSYFVGLPLYRNESIIQQPTDIRKLSDIQLEEFRTRITEYRQTNSKWFGYVAFNHVHVPLGVAKRFRNSTSSIFGDTLRELDETIGRMVATLKENGFLENTMVWLLGDNGPWETECSYAGSAGPYQGQWQRHNGGGTTGKLAVWEGGHRVPGVVSWPRMIAPNMVLDALVSSMDILPTVARLLNVTLPNDRGYDGIDLTDVLSGATAHAHEALFHPRSDGKKGNIAAVRYKNYKAVYESGGRWFLDCNQTESKHKFFDPPLLFDLSTDPAEAKALDTKIPKHAAILKTITLLLKNKMADVEVGMKSKLDRSRSDNAQPCCNRKNKHCRC